MPKINKENKTYKSFDFTLFITVILLLSLGVTMVLSASSPSSLATTGSSYTYVKKQAFCAVLGVALMLIISKIDYRKYQRFYKIAYVVSLFILLLVLVPGLRKRGKRCKTLDKKCSSEITKIGIILFFAAYLTKHKNELKDVWKGFIKPIVFFVLPIVGVLLGVQSHLSASLVIIAVVSIMMIVAGCKISHFLTLGVLGGTAGGIGLYILAKFFKKGGYRLTRIISFLNPWDYAQDEGWQIIQSLYAIGSGGLFGVGLGNSKQKYLYISEPHNDFIFAVLAEELGFIGCVAVIVLFGIFIWRGILIAMKAPDMFGSLLATGITSLIGIQAIINIAVVTSSIPVTGMALPFFSYGGTSLIILLCAVGVLLNISRQSQKI